MLHDLELIFTTEFPSGKWIPTCYITLANNIDACSHINNYLYLYTSDAFTKKNSEDKRNCNKQLTHCMRMYKENLGYTHKV